MKNNPDFSFDTASINSAPVFQKSLKQPVSCQGKGLHSGQQVNLRFLPAEAGTGIRFRRVDQPDALDIPALADYVIHTERTTVLGLEGQSVATVEHSLAAIWALDFDNVLVEIDGPEMPIFDGSAQPYVDALRTAEIQLQSQERQFLDIAEPITVMDSKRSSVVVATPSSRFALECSIDFQSKQVPGGTFSLSSPESFLSELAPARTFVFFHELEYLMDQGLIKGGDLDCALVYAEHPIPDSKLQRLIQRFGSAKLTGSNLGLLNTLSPRFTDEPLRHKVLDALGDLALVGRRIRGFITIDRPGHSINVAFARKLRELYPHD
jgi:UDP-3-O-[3-hydroxymyristoyl] N-acetylglucosamine deacetylase / 3-hydroxyacyl-[acyl-carrier-protein] dehydratase